MNENKKNITSGDILEMMVRAGLKPQSEPNVRRETDSRRNPIISVNGKDVQWHELEGNAYEKKDKAA